MSFVGKLFGADDAADAQVESAQKGIDLQKQMYDQTRTDLNPFMQFGTGLLGSLGDAMQPLDREATLGAYFNSGEFKQAQNMANNNLLAASEAMGGLGSTATANSLAAIAPQLGQGYLAQTEAQRADTFNRLMGGVNIGLNAASGLGATGQNYASQSAALMQQQGAARAGEAMAGGQIFTNLLGMGLGAAAVGGAFGGAK